MISQVTGGNLISADALMKPLVSGHGQPKVRVLVFHILLMLQLRLTSLHKLIAHSMQAW